MSRFCMPMRIALRAPAVAVALLLAGCGGGVEYNGAIFEALGVTNKPPEGPKDVPTRAPLVLPPSASLPEPGPRQTAMAPADWPDDPQLRAEAEQAEEERKRQEYYEKGDWSDERSPADFKKLIDPLERRPGVFGREIGRDLQVGESDTPGN